MWEKYIKLTSVNTVGDKIMKINKSIRKLIGASVLFIMLFSAFAGATSSMEIATESTFVRNNSPEKLDDYTHTVMVEACTLSTCPSCATAAAVMHDIYYSGEYDFYYVALVANKNSYANARCAELDVYYVPDYVFDGGYTRHVGSGGLPNAYTSRLDQCGSRDVADIDMELDITWNGDAEMDIDLSVTNNEDSTYNGHIHVYVTEIESRWNTNSGQPYHFAMVGNYAFNQNVDIPAGDTSEHSTTWDGSQYGVGDLERDNVMIIATIFNRNNNYYSDETAAASFSDAPPALEIEVSSTIGGISADITNAGEFDLSDVEWSISVTGGILHRINVSSEGIIENLAAGETVTVQTNETIFGLGKIDISATADLGIETRQGFVLGPFILLL